MCVSCVYHVYVMCVACVYHVYVACVYHVCHVYNVYSDYTIHPSHGLLEDSHQVLYYGSSVQNTHCYPIYGVVIGVHNINKMLPV